MPKATHDPTTTALRRGAKGDKSDFLRQTAPAVAALKAIAERSGDALYMCDGPVHPDHRLLDLCAEAMHANQQAERVMETIRGAVHEPKPWLDSPAEAFETLARAVEAIKQQERAQEEYWQNDRRLMTLHKQWEQKARNAMRAAAKLTATTPAGIYAKALLVKGSQGAAAVLAMSLADDFIACEGLRASLWPAEVRP